MSKNTNDGKERHITIAMYEMFAVLIFPPLFAFLITKYILRMNDGVFFFLWVFFLFLLGGLLQRVTKVQIPGRSGHGGEVYKPKKEPRAFIKEMLWGLGIGAVAGLLVYASSLQGQKQNVLMPSLSPSPTLTQEKEQDPRTLNWKQFQSDVIDFKYPADWEIPDSTKGYYVFFTNGRVMDVSWGTNVGKEGRLYKPIDFFHPSEGDVKRNENSIDGHEAIEFLANPKGIQGWPQETIVISVPEKTLLIQIHFSPALKGVEMEKQVQNVFVPLISTIRIQ